MTAGSSSKEIMFENIRQWQASGLSQKKFCLDNGIAFHSFYYWYKRFRIIDKKPAADAFVPIQVTKDNDPFASVSFSNGSTVQIYHAVSVDYLKALIS